MCKEGDGRSKASACVEIHQGGVGNGPLADSWREGTEDLTSYIHLPGN